MKELWLKYKEWWNNLAAREKKGMIAFGSLLVFFILYQWLWTPYLDTVALLRKKIKTNSVLIEWMQTTDKTIRQLENENGGSRKSSSPIIVLGKLQKQIDRASLQDTLTQFKQVENDSIELRFQKVEFDKWIKLLISMVKEEHVSIVQMSVAADHTQGLVNVELIVRV